MGVSRDGGSGRDPGGLESEQAPPVPLGDPHRGDPAVERLRAPFMRMEPDIVPPTITTPGRLTTASVVCSRLW